MSGKESSSLVDQEKYSRFVQVSFPFPSVPCGHMRPMRPCSAQFLPTSSSDLALLMQPWSTLLPAPTTQASVVALLEAQAEMEKESSRWGQLYPSRLPTSICNHHLPSTCLPASPTYLPASST